MRPRRTFCNPSGFGLTSLFGAGVSGPVFELNASPSFADLLRNVSAQVADPSREGKTLADVWEDDEDGEDGLMNEAGEKKLLPIPALGSGSGAFAALVDYQACR